MTIEEAIDQCNQIRPNSYDRDFMLQWLSELDGRIFTEIWKAHIGAENETFSGYDGSTPSGTELLAVYPYEGLYVHYLCAMVDYYNNEYARYNNGMMQFNEVYGDYSKWYNRTNFTKDVRVKVEE